MKKLNATLAGDFASVRVVLSQQKEGTRLWDRLGARQMTPLRDVVMLEASTAPIATLMRIAVTRQRANRQRAEAKGFFFSGENGCCCPLKAMAPKRGRGRQQSTGVASLRRGMINTPCCLLYYAIVLKQCSQSNGSTVYCTKNALRRLQNTLFIGISAEEVLRWGKRKKMCLTGYNKGICCVRPNEKTGRLEKKKFWGVARRLFADSGGGFRK